jgi:RNA polymerase sigma factor for flagellar operon FliA
MSKHASNLRLVNPEQLLSKSPSNDVAHPGPDPAAHLELVRRIACSLIRHLPSHVDLDELIALGNMGLVKASTRYDASRGVPFGAFAAPRIRGAMLDGLRQADPLTREERARVKRYEEESPVVLVEFSAAGDQSTGELLPDEALAARELRMQVRDALASLSERERYVATRHFFDEQPLKAIGEELGVTESRVCQIVGELVTRLRGRLGVVAPRKPGRAKAPEAAKVVSLAARRRSVARGRKQPQAISEAVG